MSYDIYFLNRREGQSWEEAVEELEAAACERCRDVSPEMAAVWERLVPQARAVLGEVEIREHDGSLDLSHRGTGIDLSVLGDEISLAVPYWHTGEQAVLVFKKVFALAAIVERETGLTAYDPQVGLPLSQADPRDLIGLMCRVTADLRNRYGVPRVP